MKKTICLLSDYKDAIWISDYWQSKSSVEDITIIAPSFEGRLVAEELKLPYKTYEEEAWKIEKNKLEDLSRNQAHRWHQLQGVEGNPLLETVRKFKDYPLLDMHQSYLFYIFFEILQAYDFIKKVFNFEQPDKVVAGKRDKPFPELGLLVNTCNYGLEREAAMVLSTNAGIEFIEMQTSSTNVFTSHKESEVLNKVVKCLRNPKVFVRKVGSVLKQFQVSPMAQIRPQPQFVFDSKLTGPKILIFGYGGYYLEKLSGTFDYLLQDKARIGLAMIGGKLTLEEESTFREKGICAFYFSDWPIENEESILSDWKIKGLDAFKSINSSEVLINYFSDSTWSYFSGLVDEAIKRELVENIPSTVRDLLRSETIIRAFEPDLVVAQFARLPLGTMGVLPARLLGIPTLLVSHGIPGYTRSEWETFATQYIAVSSNIHKYGLTKSLKCSDEIVIPVGESRLEQIKCEKNVREAKKLFGFNPDKPMCIFCDNAEWTRNLTWRHTTFKTVEQILYLKHIFPDLQIAYRVHHGGEYGQMQKYFESLNIPDIKFQISHSPLFTDIVQAADVVISHKTSAIPEALLSGVRVIYLCALAEKEPSFLNYEAIKVADNFEVLPKLVKSVIETPMTREDVRAMAQPFFDRTLCGKDGKATERLAQLMLKLTQTPETQRKKGFQDWHDRIEASCEFRSESWFEKR